MTSPKLSSFFHLKKLLLVLKKQISLDFLSAILSDFLADGDDKSLAFGSLPDILF